MKPTAVLINVGRGPLIEEGAFRVHLQRTLTFTACIAPWWREPRTSAGFDEPQIDLVRQANVVASPHNAGQVADIFCDLAEGACVNLRRFAEGQPLLDALPKHP